VTECVTPPAKVIMAIEQEEAPGPPDAQLAFTSWVDKSMRLNTAILRINFFIILYFRY
jgi:hypothetical protein